MSIHVEWLRARASSAHVFAPGEDWVAGGQHRSPVLVLGGDDVVAIEGTQAELRALAARITDAVTVDQPDDTTGSGTDTDDG